MNLDPIDTKYWHMVHDKSTLGTVQPSDISYSCPICREGNSWGRKHRLHLYIKPSYESAAVACFNCGYKNSLKFYLKEFFPKEASLYENETRSNSLDSLLDIFKKPSLDTEQDNIDIKDLDDKDIDIGIDFTSNKPSEEVIDSIIDTNVLTPLTLSNIEQHTITKTLIKMPQGAINYLNSRGIEPKKEWLYSPNFNKFTFNDKLVYLSDYIIIPLTYNGNWYGFQALAWKEKKFFVYMLKGNEGFKVWNFYDIDKDQPTYIFESIYDALSSGYPNSIAQLGATLNYNFIKQLKEPIFCLDNQRVDAKAREETMKYLELGYNCFIWPEGSEKFKDTNDLRKLNVPYEKIQHMIESNIFNGIEGLVKLKMLEI